MILPDSIWDIEFSEETAVMGFLVRCSLEVKAKSNNCCEEIRKV